MENEKKMNDLLVFVKRFFESQNEPYEIIVDGNSITVNPVETKEQ